MVIKNVFFAKFYTCIYSGCISTKFLKNKVQFEAKPLHLKHSFLTLTLLKPKVTSLCHQHRARRAYTSVQSDHAIYHWLTNFKFLSSFPQI